MATAEVITSKVGALAQHPKSATGTIDADACRSCFKRPNQEQNQHLKQLIVFEL